MTIENFPFIELGLFVICVAIGYVISKIDPKNISLSMLGLKAKIESNKETNIKKGSNLDE